MSLKSIGAGLAETAANAGKGALAGVIATAAMTASSTVEMKMRSREPSSAPADAAGKVLGVAPRDPDGEARFGEVVHWSYGTSWGGIGGALRTVIPEPAATLAHFAGVWGAEVAMLPELEIAPPVREWGAKEIAIDVFHHLVYAATFAGVWYLMDKAKQRNSILKAISA